MAGLTQDRFLGGRLTIRQPEAGYRAGVDPVVLAAAVPARPGQSVLELGCGVGVASLALQIRVGALNITGLELQPAYADLARRNAADNALALRVETGDLVTMPAGLRGSSFDHVIANPPYYKRDGRSAAADAGREAAVAEQTSLAQWIDAGVRRLATGGCLTVIQRADRAPDLIAACDARLGDLALLPLAPRAGRPASLIILHARKGARGAFRLLAPVVMHSGDRHVRDGDSYTPELTAILRRGAPLQVDWMCFL